MQKIRLSPRTVSTCLLLLASSLLAACTMGGGKHLQQFDFGAPMTPTYAAPMRTLQISLAAIEVPISLDGNAMLYRLAYDHPQALHPYASSNWSMPPAQLLAQQLKLMGESRGINIINQQDGVKHLPQLRLELIEFSQVFSSAVQSQSTLVFRASVINKNSLVAQRLFSGKAEGGANAQSGARAMHLASQDAIQQLFAWMTESDVSGK